jgi:tyrosyl-tRNA synthetase
VVAEGVRNHEQAPRISALLRAAERNARERVAPNLKDEPALETWRHAFAALGMPPGRYKSSVEALLTRVRKGEPLPNLSPAVDLANALSLTYLVPLGAHDLASVHGDLVVGPARASMTFTPLGQREEELVDDGEFVYADDRDVRTRRWVWRQSEHSKVTASSATILFPIDGWIGTTDIAVRAAQGDLARYLEEDLGARTRTFFLDAQHPSALILDGAALPEGVIAADGGFRMAGKGYLEAREHVAAPIALTPHREPSIAAPARPYDDDPIGALLRRATVDVVVREELETRLRRGDKLRVKFGVDPTSPHLHLGHAVVLRKLRAFQELGHTICLLIGDFTAQIGDASDKSSMRQMLSEEEVVQNLATYRKQIAGILDERRVEWTYNADWLGPLRFKDVVGLAQHFTVAQMIERENFTNRYAAGQPIGLHEFLYPLMQGYDSVALRADVELGGTEQLFNLLAGRTIQRAFGQPAQAVMTCALLLGLDGRKMSKSLGNCIFLDDSAKDMYGKVMRLPDEQIVPYFELCTEVPMSAVASIGAEMAAGANPMVFKKQLAYAISSLYHGTTQAQRAQEGFEREVQRRERPEDTAIPDAAVTLRESAPVADLLCALGLTPSKGEARRKVQEGAVAIDGAAVADPHAQVPVREGMLVRLGRRYRRVVFAQ